MSIVVAFVVFLIGIAAPAAANQCYWVGQQIYCDAGCRVTDRWFDGSRYWMSHSCAPPPEVMLAIAGVVLIIIIAIVGSITSSASNNAHASDIAEVEHDTATGNQITQELEAAGRKADAHLAAMLAKYRDGDHHG